MRTFLIVLVGVPALWVLFDAPRQGRTWWWGVGSVLLPILVPIYLGVTRGAKVAVLWVVGLAVVLLSIPFLPT